MKQYLLLILLIILTVVIVVYVVSSEVQTNNTDIEVAEESSKEVVGTYFNENLNIENMARHKKRLCLKHRFEYGLLQ